MHALTKNARRLAAAAILGFIGGLVMAGGEDSLFHRTCWP
jgi:hypothetical protein